MNITYTTPFPHSEEPYINLLDEQDKSKFMVWIENYNKLHLEAENLSFPDCCTGRYYVRDPKAKTWKPKFEI